MSQILFTVVTKKDNDICGAWYQDIFSYSDIKQFQDELGHNMEVTLGEPVTVQVGRDFRSVLVEAFLCEKFEYISKEIIELVAEMYNLEQKLEVFPKELIARLEACGKTVTPIYGLVGPDNHEDIVALMVDYH